nr:PREDICTED: EF-hand calcium-binding domain-containing protein 9 [Haliaeetus albicilla]
MKLKSGCFLQHLHLLLKYTACMSVRNAAALMEHFQLLDVHRKNYLNDLQFYCFLCYVTDLNKDKIMLLFDLLDRNVRGRICFNEFYTVVYTLLSHEVQDALMPFFSLPGITYNPGWGGTGALSGKSSEDSRLRRGREAVKPGLPPELNLAVGYVLQLRSGPDTWLKASARDCCLQDSGRKETSRPQDTALQVNDLEKQFIPRHAGRAFQLLDVDRDNMIDFNEFEAKRFLFNIQKEVKKIFKDIGISGDEQLNYREFKIFAVFCIDKQQKEEGDHE